MCVPTISVGESYGVGATGLRDERRLWIWKATDAVRCDGGEQFQSGPTPRDELFRRLGFYVGGDHFSVPPGIVRLQNNQGPVVQQTCSC